MRQTAHISIRALISTLVAVIVCWTGVVGSTSSAFANVGGVATLAARTLCASVAQMHRVDAKVAHKASRSKRRGHAGHRSGKSASAGHRKASSRLSLCGTSLAARTSRTRTSSRHPAPIKTETTSTTTKTATTSTKTETVKAEAPKTETTKTESAKTETAKTEAVKTETAKTETASAGGLTAVALSPDIVQLSWTPLAGASTVQISYEGHMVDEVPAVAGTTYTVHELWQSTRYQFTVKQLSASGTVIGTQEGAATTPAWTEPIPRLYASDDFINQPVPTSPELASNSVGIVEKAIVPYVENANFADNEYWGSPIVYADQSTLSYSIACTEYLYRCTSAFQPQRIPASAEATLGSDHRLTVIEPGGQELDMWDAKHEGNAWNAGMRSVTSTEGSAADCTSGQPNCYGANAAHFADAAGIVRPEEIAQGRIEHALVITTPYTRANYIACPATGTDGTNEDPNAIPIGAHVQLDPSVDVSKLGLARWQEVIARALQQYGAYVIDSGGSLAVRAEADNNRGYNAWAKAGVPTTGASLSKLPWNDVRVLSMTQCARS